MNATGFDLQGDIAGIDLMGFQWAPTLGGECYAALVGDAPAAEFSCFNGHPPLGVNATELVEVAPDKIVFCVSMGTHPWG